MKKNKRCGAGTTACAPDAEGAPRATLAETLEAGFKPNPKNEPSAAEGVAAAGKTTLAEASRDRLAKPLVDQELWSDFEEATGEPVDPRNPPTWAELIAARQARRAATSENGTRDAKELREAAEESKNDSASVVFLLRLDDLPRTNAVTNKTTMSRTGAARCRAANGASALGGSA